MEDVLLFATVPNPITLSQIKIPYTIRCEPTSILLPSPTFDAGCEELNDILSYIEHGDSTLINRYNEFLENYANTIPSPELRLRVKISTLYVILEARNQSTRLGILQMYMYQIYAIAIAIQTNTTESLSDEDLNGLLDNILYNRLVPIIVPHIGINTLLCGYFNGYSLIPVSLSPKPLTCKTIGTNGHDIELKSTSEIISYYSILADDVADSMRFGREDSFFLTRDCYINIMKDANLRPSITPMMIQQRMSGVDVLPKISVNELSVKRKRLYLLLMTGYFIHDNEFTSYVGNLGEPLDCLALSYPGFKYEEVSVDEFAGIGKFVVVDNKINFKEYIVQHILLPYNGKYDNVKDLYERYPTHTIQLYYFVEDE